MQPTYRGKLIEVDLPLDEINHESRKDASITYAHPSTLHRWWARRPLAACRAVIFASMVDDPSFCQDEFPTKEEQDRERERLHGLIKRIVKWENSSDEGLIAEARYEIARSVARFKEDELPSRSDPDAVLRYLNDKALPLYDPFAGGGSIPLEAQRLGLRAIASDLNPVAVLINKALIELPPKFSGKPPVNPKANLTGMFTGKQVGRGKNKKPEQVPWRGAAGLISDIGYYGKWMREEAFKRIGHLYPKAKLPDGGEATVIAWLWVRTVPCPNPACGIAMPLIKTFQLSRKANNRYWTKPIIERKTKTVSFVVQDNDSGVPTGGTVNRKGATCIGCGNTVMLSWVREQAIVGNMNRVMTAIVADGDRNRVYLSPTSEHIEIAFAAEPLWRPTGRLPDQARSISVQVYGFTEWHQLFTDRQLLALNTFSDLVSTVRQNIILEGGTDEYASAVCIYLALIVGRTAEGGSSFTIWENGGNFIAPVFGRQGIGMVWDFPEANIFSDSTQNWMAQVKWVTRVLDRLPVQVNDGLVYHADATTTIHANNGPVIVTDPPYYDNISYSDSSDFFYVWLRPLLRDIEPDLFASILTPKSDEMVANRFRFDDHRQRFESLLLKSLKLIRERCSPEFPSSIFYAYKQQEEQRDGVMSTGWETMLNAVTSAKFQIVGTWPMRTERPTALKNNVNALASSVILVCRPRADDAPVAIGSEFLDALNAELPAALDRLTHESHINPVDLRQAAIGPGMSVYSRYSRIETLSGDVVSVREALMAINVVVSEYMEREDGQLDTESRFCLDWLRAHPSGDGKYEDAENLARVHNLAVEERLEHVHNLLTADAGDVHLLGVGEYALERRYPALSMTAWEGCLRMAWHMGSGDERGGVDGCADVLNRADESEDIERLARILYDFYDQHRDSQHAVMFNNVVASWDSIVERAAELRQGSNRLFQ